MTTAADWYEDVTIKKIAHIDGILNYDGNTGTAPSLYDMVRDAVTGAIGQVIGGSDLGGTNGTGTLTLSGVTGRFGNNNSIVVLDTLGFDTVLLDPSFIPGATIDEVGAGTAQIIVDRIKYNDTTVAGVGTIFGRVQTAGFLNNDGLEIASTQVADATGAEVDNSGLFTGALVDEATTQTIQPPGTNNTSILVNFDNPGSPIAIPEEAQIQEVTGASPTKTAKVEQKYSKVAVGDGSFRLVNVEGSWADDDDIFINNVLNYQNLVANQKFNVGDEVLGVTSTFRGRVIDVNTAASRLILASRNGDFTNGEDLEVDGVKIAEAEASVNHYLDSALNVNGAPRTRQRATQGGIYTNSLNIVRRANDVYSHFKDVFDELDKLNTPSGFVTPPPVADQIYKFKLGWTFLDDLDMRFINRGSFQDEGNNNVWTNLDIIGTLRGQSPEQQDFTATKPLPNIYIQRGSVLEPQFWLEGFLNANIKVRTNTRPDITTTAEGLLIATGPNMTLFCREFGDNYDHVDVNIEGGIATVAMSTSIDANNGTGSHTLNFSAGGAGAFTVGEEIQIAGDDSKIGIVVTSDCGTDGDVTYILKTGTNFVASDSITGAVSAKNATVDTVASVVDGYGTDIQITHTDIRVGVTGGAGIFIPGEPISQATSGAVGTFLEDDGTFMYIEKDVGSAAFDGTNIITGGTSAATRTANVAEADRDTSPFDIGDGAGDQQYIALIAMDITGADPQTVAKGYEWSKWETRELSVVLYGGKGLTPVGTEGRFYRATDSTKAEVKPAPFGLFSGGKWSMAPSVFLIQVVGTDGQNYDVTDEADVNRFPPNIQALIVSSPLLVGKRVLVTESTASGSQLILEDPFAVDAVAGPNNGTGDTIIKVVAGTRAVPMANHYPDTGVLLVRNAATQLFESFAYTALDRVLGEFTVSALGADLTAGEDVYVPYIREQAGATSISKSVIYSGSDVFVVIICRQQDVQDIDNLPNTFGVGGMNAPLNILDDEAETVL